MSRKRHKTATVREKDKLFKQIHKYRDSILKGNMLALDPSCASTSSDPGYAIFRKGKLADRGIIEVEGKGSMTVPQRLQAIRRCMIDDFSEENIDVIVIEDVSKLPYRTGSNQTTKAQGVMIAALDCEKVLEIHPSVWQNLSRDLTYEKSDDMDAEYIGRAILKVLSLKSEEDLII